MSIAFVFLFVFFLLFPAPVVFLRSISVAKVAEVVVPTQVFQQLIVVKVTVVTELAERVTPVAGVVRVSVGPVPSQFLAVIPLALMREDLIGIKK